MVDRDKLRDRMDSGGNDSSSDTSGNDGPSRRDVAKSSSNKKSESEKVEAFKKGSGVSSASPSSKGGVPVSDVEDVLKAIANVLLYAEGKSRAVDEPSNAREKYSKTAADNVYDQFTEIASTYEVQLIAEKYGIDWEQDIIVDVLKEQDYTGKVGV